MPYIEESLVKFNRLPAEIILTVDSDWVSNDLMRIENKYKIKLSPLMVFVTVGDIMMDGVERYVQIELGLDEMRARAVNNDLQQQIFRPLLKRLNLINSHPKKEMTPKEEMNYLLDVFSANLLKEFSENFVITEIINSRIFNILSKDLKFKDELEKALYMNGELLTHENFELDNKTQSPTIGNWIQDFIIFHGGGIFDNLVLTKYLTESNNAKRLPDTEKILVRKLLNLYRNIKFFPESMPNDDGIDWEIIPTNKEGLNKEPRKPIGLPKTEEEKKIEELKREEEEFSAGGLERLAIEEEIQGKKKLEDLKIEMNKYAAGSLERMVVEEEVRKLEVRK